MQLTDALAYLNLPAESQNWELAKLHRIAKKHYKKLAHKYHPDKGGSKEAFQKLRDALDLVLAVAEPILLERDAYYLFELFKHLMLGNVGKYLLEHKVLRLARTRHEIGVLGTFYAMSCQLGYINRHHIVAWFPADFTYPRFKLLYGIYFMDIRELERQYTAGLFRI